MVESLNGRMVESLIAPMKYVAPLLNTLRPGEIGFTFHRINCHWHVPVK